MPFPVFPLVLSPWITNILNSVTKKYYFSQKILTRNRISPLLCKQTLKIKDGADLTHKILDIFATTRIMNTPVVLVTQFVVIVITKSEDRFFVVSTLVFLLFV